MLRSILVLTCTAAAFVVGVTACIVTCNDIACGGGFEWSGRPAGDAALDPGQYHFVITLEDDVYEVDCEVGASYGDSSCGEPEHVVGEVEYTLNLSVTQADPEDWDPGDPVSGFLLRASDTSGSDDAGYYTEFRGPGSVSIQISHDEAELGSVDYQLEYVRDENYFGDPACGYCDEVEVREHEW